RPAADDARATPGLWLQREATDRRLRLPLHPFLALRGATPERRGKAARLAEELDHVAVRRRLGERVLAAEQEGLGAQPRLHLVQQGRDQRGQAIEAGLLPPQGVAASNGRRPRGQVACAELD